MDYCFRKILLFDVNTRVKWYSVLYSQTCQNDKHHVSVTQSLPRMVSDTQAAVACESPDVRVRFWLVLNSLSAVILFWPNKGPLSSLNLNTYYKQVFVLINLFTIHMAIEYFVFHQYLLWEILWVTYRYI